MTFLLDHDTPDDLAYSLQAIGHQTIFVRDVLPRNAHDEAILSLAHDQGWIIIRAIAMIFWNWPKSSLTAELSFYSDAEPAWLNAPPWFTCWIGPVNPAFETTSTSRKLFSRF